MEELARDATGWGAHAVEFFRFLGDTQYMNHVRARSHYAPDLRNWKPGLYIDTGFDRTAHKVDVRRIGASIATAPREQGRYNIQNIGIFLWSLGAWSVTKCPATPSADPGRRLSASVPSAWTSRSFTRQSHRASSRMTPTSTTPPNPSTSPTACAAASSATTSHRGVGARYYGPGNSLVVVGQRHSRSIRSSCRSATSPEPMGHGPTRRSPRPTRPPSIPNSAASRCPPPAAGTHAPTVTVSYDYGFNADLGGGEYPRAAGYIPTNATTRINAFLVTDPAAIVPFPDLTGSLGYSDLQGAVDFATDLFNDNGLVAVEIGGSGIITTGPLVIRLPADVTLELRAAEGAARPCCSTAKSLSPGAPAAPWSLNGLLIAAAPATAPTTPAPIALVHAPELQADGSFNRLSQLNLVHCTLVPGWSVATNGAPPFPRPAHAGRRTRQPRRHRRPQHPRRRAHQPAGQLHRNRQHPGCAPARPPSPTPHPTGAITGPSGGALTLIGCTVIGKVHATLFPLISDSILWAWLDPSRRPEILARPADRRPQAIRLRPLQLSAHRRHHSTPVPVRRESPERTPAALLRAALRSARLLQTACFDRRPHPPRCRRRR